MPILLEDLYPPPARSVYRRVRTWEQNLSVALEEDALGGLPGERRRRLGDHARRAARELRRHLLYVQRLRHLVASDPHQPESHPLYALWTRQRIGWSGGASQAVDALETASEPFLGWNGASTIPLRACDHLERVIDRVVERAGERTALIRDALTAHAGSERRPS